MLYMLTAGKKALEDGGVTDDVIAELDKTKCGIVIGSALGGLKVSYQICNFRSHSFYLLFLGFLLGLR